jgi:hypothetical protein
MVGGVGVHEVSSSSHTHTNTPSFLRGRGGFTRRPFPIFSGVHHTSCTKICTRELPRISLQKVDVMYDARSRNHYGCGTCRSLMKMERVDWTPDRVDCICSSC